MNVLYVASIVLRLLHQLALALARLERDALVLKGDARRVRAAGELAPVANDGVLELGSGV